MKKKWYAITGSIVVLIVAVSLFMTNNPLVKKEKAIADFLHAIGYKEVDFDAKDILTTPHIIEEVEEMTGVKWEYVDFVNIHAESSLDNNLSAKGYIPLSRIESFIKQFMEITNENIYSIEFDKEITPFGDSYLRWWRPVQTKLSRTVNVTRISNTLKILITPVDDAKAEIYIFWFEM